MSFRRTGKWGNEPQGDLSQRELEARRRTATMRERVLDDELRALVEEFNTQQARSGLARTEGDADAAIMALEDAFRRTNRRLGEVLRKLYR